KLRFTPGLEAEFVGANLVRNRPLIRVTCALALLLSVSGSFGLLIDQGLTAATLLHILLVSVGTALLAWLAFGFLFERLYLPFAQIYVPIRNALVAIFVAHG